MTNNEIIKFLQSKQIPQCGDKVYTADEEYEAYQRAIDALEQQPCEMTTEEYRQRMIQTFHNADTDELIAVCVLPTEKEFEHLEWLLKNHYKKAPCVDAISRQAVLDLVNSDWKYEGLETDVASLPPVTPQQKYGKWILADEQNKEDVENDNYRFICSECQCSDIHAKGTIVPYCWKCGAKMQESEDKE